MSLELVAKILAVTIGELGSSLASLSSRTTTSFSRSSTCLELFLASFSMSFSVISEGYVCEKDVRNS
jgi:hypothetical protein